MPGCPADLASTRSDLRTQFCSLERTPASSPQEMKRSVGSRPQVRPCPRAASSRSPPWTGECLPGRTAMDCWCPPMAAHHGRWSPHSLPKRCVACSRMRTRFMPERSLMACLPSMTRACLGLICRRDCLLTCRSSPCRRSEGGCSQGSIVGGCTLGMSRSTLGPRPDRLRHSRLRASMIRLSPDIIPVVFIGAETWVLPGRRVSPKVMQLVRRYPSFQMLPVSYRPRPRFGSLGPMKIWYSPERPRASTTRRTAVGHGREREEGFQGRVRA
jgi:hypothetical protein